VLVIILFLALILRTIKLAQTPSGFHADEASFYINALAISQTGMDEDGNRLPLSLNSLIDPKPALYSYFQIPFLNLFKDQIFAARLPSAILAVLTLLVVYFFISEFVSKRIALLTILVLTVSPWHLIVSRGTQEVIASFLFLVTTLWLLVLLLKKTKKQNLALNASFFVTSFLSMYFYHSAKVVLPLLAISLIAYFYKKSKVYFKKSLYIIAFIIIAELIALSIQESNSRLAAVSIFSDQSPRQKMFEQIYTTNG
jgi:4-amino-4-deoxy-L-arabinose transferase-like glycosyltransferase